MKLPIVFLFAASIVAAQDVDKVTVPLHDPSRPAQIHVQLMEGGMTIRGYSGKDVLVESHPRDGRGEGRHSRSSSPPNGMHRIDGGGMGLDVTEDNNNVNIKSSVMNRGGDLIVSVPRRSNLRLNCMNDGDIVVEDVDGEIDADNLNGRVTLNNVSGTVTAHSLNGDVVVTASRLDPSKPASFSTLNGKIDVTLPSSTRANVLMKTDNGEIYSDFEVKVVPGRVMSEQSSKDGSFHVHLDHAVRGTINGGGPDYKFTSFNGEIFIRKGK